MEEREEGHEVRWKRSNLTAGENSSLQRSHKGLTQPLNTRHVSRCATHKPPKRYLFVSVAPSHIHTHKLYTLYTVIGISPQFATSHQNDDCRCSESGVLFAHCQQPMYMRQSSFIGHLMLVEFSDIRYISTGVYCMSDNMYKLQYID